MLRIGSFLIAAAFVVAMPASADPSFNCANAQSATENAICDVPNLQWTDRQMARLYKLALTQKPQLRRPIQAGQRSFLVGRDACGDDTDCIERAYRARLTELSKYVNVYAAFAEYEPQGMGGSMWIVRFGYDAAVRILTVGSGDHTCWFDTDSAPQGGKGVIRYADKGANACRITIAPDGDDVMVVQTKNCSDYCGMRAILDARYTRVP
ncbi:MAG: lysozyme inhibitor LprI family protein [Micropepsaceae bacterium]